MKNAMICLSCLVAAGTVFCADNAAASVKSAAAEKPGAAVESASALPAKPSFNQLRNFAPNEKMRDALTSARIIYKVTESDLSQSVMMIRAKKYDMVRFDTVKGTEHFCAVKNGANFWMCEKGTGAVDMEAYDAANFNEFSGLMVFSFNKKKIFTDPVFLKEEIVNKVTRSVFEVKELNGDGTVFQLHVDNKACLMRKARKVETNGDVTVFMYRDYKKFNGYQLPRTILAAGPRGNYKLDLVTADWNLNIADSVFTKTNKVEDNDVVLLKSAAQAKKAAVAEKKTFNANAVKIASIEKRIRKLKLEIADCKKRMELLADVGKADRDDAVSVGSITSPSSGGRSYYWNGGWGWGVSHDRAANRDSRTRRKMVKMLAKGAQYSYDEYKKEQDKLLRKQIELGELEYELKKLKGE